MESVLKGSGNPDGSSEENDRADQVKGETNNSRVAATRRSYDCTFCKRGFTNAQALGGHMNIHRKDRAKAKQIISSSDQSCRPMNNIEEYGNPRYIPPIAGDHHRPAAAKYFPVLDSERNYMYFQPPVLSSPRNPHGYLDSDFLVPSSVMNHEEVLGANLSLQIGAEDGELNREIMKEDEIDLELRLGHHHP